TDSGFAEAAADALFATLVQLDKGLGGKLLKSPVHLVGFNRGAVVNTEIAQRLGTYFPGTVPDLQVTTLDPHDTAQGSLDIPLADYLKLLATRPDGLALIGQLLTAAKAG